MAYPVGVITRTCTVGGSAAVESGTDLVISVSIEASRGLIRDGERMPSSPEVKTSTAGGEVSFTLPVSDQSGYRDEATGAVIDVSAPDSHTHTYTATITTTRGATGLVNQRVVDFPLPAGDLSPVDVDTLVDAGVVDGVLVSVPDTWGAMVAAAQAAAESAVGQIPTAVADYLTANPPSGSPDATALAKGIVRLAGDLGGTADAPTVPGLAGKEPARGADDNYVTDAEKANLHTHPAVIAQGATQTDARSAIGAGTSSLALGTTAGTAKAGDYEPDLSGLSARLDALEAGGGTGGGGGVAADDTPAAPAEGESASYLVSSAVTWPAGLVWSTDPDGGVAPTITGAALVSMFTVGGITRAIMGATFPAPADTTAPSIPAGLSATAASSTSVNLAWSASTDAVGVTGYEYRVGGGAAVDAGAGLTETVTGLTASTLYSFEVRAYDAAGNRSGWSTAASATTSAPPADSTPPTVGTMAASSITASGFTLTVSGASDAVALHATPYAFTTNGGSTWSAYQSSPAYVASGLTAATGYSCNWRVRDAAGNVSTGTAQTVTTGAAAVSLKAAISALSPTLFAPLDDAPGTTSPVNLGTGGATLTVSGSGTFGAAGIAGGTSSWAGGSSAQVVGPVDTIDGDTTCSGFVTIATTAAVGTTEVMGSSTSWVVKTQPLSGGTAIGVGMTFSGATIFYAGAATDAPIGTTFTFGWSMDPTGGAKAYINGALAWSGAASAMKSGALTKGVARASEATTRIYCSALWSGVALTAGEHLALAQAAGVA